MAVEYARILRDLADVHFPTAQRIVLVPDNLNTHVAASLYEAFEPAEARRIIARLEWHYTSRHGSWLNRAEPELAVPSSQSLARRIADAATLASGVAAWPTRRNTHNAKANGHFTSADACVKLKDLYRSIQKIRAASIRRDANGRRFAMCRIVFLAFAVLVLAPVSAGAQVLKKEPAPGQLANGERVLVDDGTCPAGQIKEVVGGSGLGKDGRRVSGGSAQRTRRCIKKQ
jgi:hypothetical protein